MPYIEQQDRTELDPKIKALADQIISLTKRKDSEASFAGLLNYCCTRLVLIVLRGLFDKLRYWHVALVVGTFKNTADEFYRRIGAPYEDFCIYKNGDVEEIKWFNWDIAESRKHP